MKKTISKILSILVLLVILFLSGNILLGLYYKQNFAVNTWVNGVYCTGSSIDEISKQLEKDTSLPNLTIIDSNGTEWLIMPEDYELRADYTSALKKVMKQRSNYFWTKTLFEPYRTEIEPESYRWNHEKLIAFFESLPFAVEDAEKPYEVKVELSETEGYTFFDGKKHRLNKDRVADALANAISEKKWKLNLEEDYCYEDLAYTDEDKNALALWEKLQDYFKTSIIYDMGAEKLELTPKILSSFLNKNGSEMPIVKDDGSLSVNESLVNEWIDQLGEVYNTAKTTRDFKSTKGDIVQVTYNTYGTLIDLDAEKEYLFTAINDKKKEVHIPVYLQEGFYKGADDIGPTYIEVDMTDQKLYYYVDGELKISSDVVTGNMRRKTSTPEGINFVYGKQRNRVLRGQGYATPVKYWIPVVGHIGIHDASWRKEFGGDIYLKDGSHGCINTPTPEVSELYDMVEIGTPVVMFY